MNDDDFRITIATSLGRIEQKIDSYSIQLSAHIADDKTMADDIVKLKLSGARQKGILAALATVGSVLGAGAGYAVDLLTRGH
jgi:hypothetical protein